MILAVFTLRVVRKTIAGRGVDTIIISLPAYIVPAHYPKGEGEAETPAP